MRKPVVTCLRPRLWYWSVILLSLSLAKVSGGQQLIFGFGIPPTAELTQPQVDLISGATASRLKQARALVAGKNWDEVIDIYVELAADETGRVVALDDSRYVDVRTYCNLQLSKLPAEALAAYRRRIDPLAERWYRDGLAARDERLLRRVVNEAFCSSLGDDALMALAELELEAGQFESAQSALQQISPQLRAPDGQPAWLALRNANLDANWPEIERRWQERSKQPEWLAYPDTNLDLADVRARLILAAVRAGQWDRADLELALFRRLHPDAVGRLGGQQGPYVAAIERLMSSAHEWPPLPTLSNFATFAGSPNRSAVAAPVGPVDVDGWAKPISLAAPLDTRNNTRIVGQDGFGSRVLVTGPQIGARESDRPLNSFPVIADGVVIVADADRIRAAGLDTGKPAITAGGILYRNAAREDGLQLPTETTGFVAHGVPRYTLTVSDGVVFGRVGAPATSRVANPTAPSDRLIGFDLRREGLLALKIPPDAAGWSFDGVPVANAGRLYVAMRHSDVTPHAYVACFDAATSAQLWRTSIGAADTPAAGASDEITHNLLTLVDNRIYFNTNLGLVAALNANDGKLRWLRRYRAAGQQFSRGGDGPLYFDRDPSPCVFHNGLVIVAPADSPAVFAFDADTGLLLWKNEGMTDALQLLGVAGQRLIVSGNRLRSVNAQTGKVEWTWPESEHAGIRGMGRGVVAGDEIFWPTRNEIYVLNATTGARTRSPIPFGEISHDGANLAVAGNRLIVAGPEKVMALGPNPAAAPSERNGEVQISTNN